MLIISREKHPEVDFERLRTQDLEFKMMFIANMLVKYLSNLAGEGTPTNNLTNFGYMSDKKVELNEIRAKADVTRNSVIKQDVKDEEGMDVEIVINNILDIALKKKQMVSCAFKMSETLQSKFVNVVIVIIDDTSIYCLEC